VYLHHLKAGVLRERNDCGVGRLIARGTGLRRCELCLVEFQDVTLKYLAAVIASVEDTIIACTVEAPKFGGCLTNLSLLTVPSGQGRDFVIGKGRRRPNESS
jgi:hypothetical protein